MGWKKVPKYIQKLHVTATVKMKEKALRKLFLMRTTEMKGNVFFSSFTLVNKQLQYNEKYLGQALQKRKEQEEKFHGEYSSHDLEKLSYFGTS